MISKHVLREPFQQYSQVKFWAIFLYLKIDFQYIFGHWKLKTQNKKKKLFWNVFANV